MLGQDKILNVNTRMLQYSATQTSLTIICQPFEHVWLALFSVFKDPCTSYTQIHALVIHRSLVSCLCFFPWIISHFERRSFYDENFNHCGIARSAITSLCHASLSTNYCRRLLSSWWPSVGQPIMKDITHWVAPACTAGFLWIMQSVVPFSVLLHVEVDSRVIIVALEHWINQSNIQTGIVLL